MKVKELIALLAAQDPEMEVLVTELVHNEGILVVHEPDLEITNVGDDDTGFGDHVYPEDLLNEIDGDIEAAKEDGEPESEWPTRPVTRKAVVLFF